MNKITMALTALMLLALAFIMAPNILALNRGKVLRNIAAWLAIFVVLGLVYQLFGPGGTGLKGLSLHSLIAPAQEQQAAPAADSKNNGDQGFIPPKE